MVATVLALAAAAAADALDRRPDGEPLVARPGTAAVPPEWRSEAPPARFAAAGAYLHTRVLRDGREYLSARAVDLAFPTRHKGPFDIADLTVAKDGTLALAVYRFPADHPAHAGIELWRGRRLVGAFTVAPGTVGGGLAFSPDGDLILMRAIDGRRVAYTRSGRRAL